MFIRLATGPPLGRGISKIAEVIFLQLHCNWTPNDELTLGIHCFVFPLLQARPIRAMSLGDYDLINSAQSNY